MRIILIRHGESHGNIDQSLYARQGDCDIELTDSGWLQAIDGGRFLSEYYHDKKVDKWPHIYLSEYTRTRQTLSGILHGMNNPFEGVPKLNTDSRLIEKFFGATSLLQDPASLHNRDFSSTLNDVSLDVYKTNPFVARNPLGESDKDVLIAIKSFIDGSLSRDMQDGCDDIFIVTHGAVIRAFIMAWFHISFRDKQKVQTPGNLDIIEITGETKDWKVRKIYDGQSRERVDINLMDGIKRVSVEDLPSVPYHLRIKP